MVPGIGPRSNCHAPLVFDSEDFGFMKLKIQKMASLESVLHGFVPFSPPPPPPPSSRPPTIYWIRQDLRLVDNPALTAAVQRGGAVVPVFIWDVPVDACAASPTKRWELPPMGAMAGRWPVGRAAAALLEACLGSLDASYRTRYGIPGIVMRRGDAKTELLAIAKDVGAEKVVFNRQYEPWLAQRDNEIRQALLSEASISSETFNATLLVEPELISREVVASSSTSASNSRRSTGTGTGTGRSASSATSTSAGGLVGLGSVTHFKHMAKRAGAYPPDLSDILPPPQPGSLGSLEETRQQQQQQQEQQQRAWPDSLTLAELRILELPRRKGGPTRGDWTRMPFFRETMPGGERGEREEAAAAAAAASHTRLTNPSRCTTGTLATIPARPPHTQSRPETSSPPLFPMSSERDRTTCFSAHLRARSRTTTPSAPSKLTLRQ